MGPPGLRDLPAGGCTHLVPREALPGLAGRRRGGAEAQVLEGGARFPLLQPQGAGESRYITGTGSKFTGEDKEFACYQNVGSVRQ